MRILVLNQDWFVKEWNAWGHEVKSWGSAEQFDLIDKTPLIPIDEVIDRANFSGPVDAIVYYDNSMPITILGLEKTTIPILFYSVDSHHHSFWHKYFAAVCDKTLVAHKDYIDIFQKEGIQVEWLPLWASRDMLPSDDKKHGAVFVGTMDPDLNPQRVEFFNKLNEIADIEILRGEFWKIYPFSKIILNQTVKGDLNFRVFESMISGTMLLTERTENGLSDLFIDGEDLICYDKNNVNQAAELIKKYLDDSSACRAIGMRGREKILKFHTIEHRARTVLGELENLSKVDHPQRNFFGMMAYMCAGIRYENISTSHAALCITSACSLIQKAIKVGEPISDFISMYAILACIEMDRMIPGNSGHYLLGQLQQAYRDNPMLRLASARSFLNRGLMRNAQKLVVEAGLETATAYSAAETIIQKIIDLKKNKQYFFAQ